MSARVSSTLRSSSDQEDEERGLVPASDFTSADGVEDSGQGFSYPSDRWDHSTNWMHSMHSTLRTTVSSLDRLHCLLLGSLLIACFLLLRSAVMVPTNSSSTNFTNSQTNALTGLRSNIDPSVSTKSGAFLNTGASLQSSDPRGSGTLPIDFADMQSPVSVLMPHFHNVDVALISLAAMIRRQSLLRCVHYTVLLEDGSYEERRAVEDQIMDMAQQLNSEIAVESFAHLNDPNAAPCKQSVTAATQVKPSELSMLAMQTAEKVRMDAAAAIHKKVGPLRFAPSPVHSLFFTMRVLHFPISEKGGGSLHRFHNLVNVITRSQSESELVVLCDTDVIVLADAWDTRVASLLTQPADTNTGQTDSPVSNKGDEALSTASASSPATSHTSAASHLPHVLAAINPRDGPFGGNAEWNFLAFRASFFHRFLDEFTILPSSAFDFGHWWSSKANMAGLKTHLWPATISPIERRSPRVVGDDRNPAFALHFFYTSRQHGDASVGEEKQWICTEEEYTALLQLATTPRVNLEQIRQWKQKREEAAAATVLTTTQ